MEKANFHLSHTEEIDLRGRIDDLSVNAVKALIRGGVPLILFVGGYYLFGPVGGMLGAGWAGQELISTLKNRKRRKGMEQRLSDNLNAAL